MDTLISLLTNKKFSVHTFLLIRMIQGRKRQKHVIREEITQSLGFLNDTYDYPESIFYQGYSESNTFFGGR